MVHDYDPELSAFRHAIFGSSSFLRVAVLSVAGGTFGVNHFPNIEIGSWIKLLSQTGVG